VAALHAQNARLRLENERLRLENERLRMLPEDKGAQVAEPGKRVARLMSRNSGNSSMPPRTDDRLDACATAKPGRCT
jgi:regulator of replication initiation timing